MDTPKSYRQSFVLAHSKEIKNFKNKKSAKTNIQQTLLHTDGESFL